MNKAEKEQRKRLENWIDEEYNRLNLQGINHNDVHKIVIPVDSLVALLDKREQAQEVERLEVRIADLVKEKDEYDQRRRAAMATAEAYRERLQAVAVVKWEKA